MATTPPSQAPPRGGGPGRERWRHLPESVRLEDTISSVEMGPPPEEKDDYWRELEWMLRTTGGA